MTTEILTDTRGNGMVERRRFLAGTLTAIGAAGVTYTAQAQDEAQRPGSAGGKNGALVAAALHCANEADICLEHCIETFRGGSTMLANCSDLVAELSAVCTALAKLGIHDSAHLKAMAAVSISTCTDCEKECRMHAGHHAQCKTCADSCLACIAAANKLLG